jgi:hypothetical protein
MGGGGELPLNGKGERPENDFSGGGAGISRRTIL